MNLSDFNKEKLNVVFATDIDKIIEVINSGALTDKDKLKELKDDFTTQTGTRLPLAKLLNPDFEKNARFFQKIAQIETSVPFNITLDQLKLNIDQQKRRQWYEYLEFYSLLKTA